MRSKILTEEDKDSLESLLEDCQVPSMKGRKAAKLPYTLLMKIDHNVPILPVPTIVALSMLSAYFLQYFDGEMKVHKILILYH